MGHEPIQTAKENTTTATILIQQQRQRLQQLKDDASDIAEALADQLWDKFEIEI